MARILSESKYENDFYPLPARPFYLLESLNLMAALSLLKTVVYRENLRDVEDWCTPSPGFHFYSIIKIER